MINTSNKGLLQSNPSGSMTTKNSEQPSHVPQQASNDLQKRHGSNFFKELTNSLYDNKQVGVNSILSNQSRQNVNNQVIQAIGQTGGVLTAKNSILMVNTKSTTKSSKQEGPTLKKKIISSGVQILPNGNNQNQAPSSLSNYSSSCNVTLTQSTSSIVKNSSTAPQSAAGSRKNSKDQQANKPYVSSKSPTPISILSQYASNQSRQQSINSVAATLSPKDSNKQVFVFKPNAPSPSNSILLQSNNYSRQQQQSPLNYTNEKRSQQTNSQMVSVNSTSSAKNTSQIFQRVYELKKKYQNINEITGIISAPMSKGSSPDTRNQSTHSQMNNIYINQSNHSSCTSISSPNSQQQQTLINNFIIAKKKSQDEGQGSQSELERFQVSKKPVQLKDIQQDRMIYELNNRSPVNSHIQKSPQANPTNLKLKNPKEQIIQHIGKYIQRKQGTVSNQQNVDSEYVNEEILQNLREFLSYLEEKKIINTSKLENNKDEMNNLIKDLMKLDLAKFSKPRCNSSHRRGSASPSVGQNPQMNQEFQNPPTINQNLFNQRHNSQQNSSNPQGQFIFNQQPDSKGEAYQQKMNDQQNQNSRQVPTIQLMINTNVNNFCITPVGSQSNINSTKNINNVTNNYNIYPGNPSPGQEPTLPPKQVNGMNQRRGSDSNVIQQQVNNKVQEQHAAQNLNTHKRNVSDNNLLQNRNHKDLNQKQPAQEPKTSNGHRKNMPSIDPSSLNASRNAENKSNVSSQQHHASELQKSVISNNQPNEENDSNQVTLNEDILNEREKIIKFIKAYIKRHNEIPPTTLDYYKFVKLIGKGAFGKVTLGVHKLTGKYVAIKTIDKSYMKDEYSRRKVFQEVYILKKIRHSCVIRLLEVFESPKHFLMVMEYAGGGDLLQYVKKRKRLDEDTSRAIFKQIVYGLGHCHCRSVLHRDVKLDNVLMDGEGGVKLCDFGVSRLVKKHQIIKEQCGTPAYLAPEIILDQGYEGFYADVWSLGVLLYAMLQGTVPFKANNIADLHKLILKGDFEFAYQGICEDAKDLIRKMLVLTPEKRISITEMLNHPWVKEPNECMEDDDDEHDLKVGATFFRQECMNGIIGPGNGGQMESGNINFINVENLYYKSSNEAEGLHEQSKIKYSDYCALTEDFMTYRIDEEAISIVESYGYNRKMIIDSINKGEINHATSSYYLLIHSTTQ